MTEMSQPAGWRTVDIVVAAVIAVAFGVVFWAWNVVTLPLFSGQVNPLAYLVSGVWLLPGVLAMLVIRKPGAALFAEVLAAAVSALLGSAWGLDTILSGAVQGAGAELVFAALFYRSFGLPIAFLAGAGSAVGEWLFYREVGRRHTCCADGWLPRRLVARPERQPDDGRGQNDRAVSASELRQDGDRSDGRRPQSVYGAMDRQDEQLHRARYRVDRLHLHGE